MAIKILAQALRSDADVRSYAAVRPQLDAVLKDLGAGHKSSKVLQTAVAALDRRHTETILGWAQQGQLSTRLMRALANSPDAQVRASVNQLIRGESPALVPAGKRSLFARILPGKAPVVPPAPERDLRRGSPRRPDSDLLQPDFEGDAAAMHEISPALRASYQTMAKTVLAEHDGAGRFLGFIANSSAAAEGSNGMISAQAVAYMHAALARAAKTLEGAELQAAQRVLRGYKGLLTSAVINTGARLEVVPTKAFRAENALALALNADGAGMLESGYINHTTVTRVAALPKHETAVSVALMQYRKQAEQALKLAGVSPDGAGLHHAFHVHMTLEQVNHPSIRQLFTDKNCMVWPSSKPGHVQVTVLRNGVLSHRHVLAHTVGDLILRDNRQPIGDAVKMTLHNGGSGAHVVRGATKSYDQRYSVPLSDASQVLARIMDAINLPKYEHRAFMDMLERYNADSNASKAISPEVAAQELGNCTVHSQKLALLYAFQHTGDGIAGTPGAEELINPDAGKRLFATLWAAVLKETQTAAIRARGGEALSENAQQGVDTELQWLGTLLLDTPARAEPRLSELLERAANESRVSKQKRHTPAPSLRHAPPRLPSINETPPAPVVDAPSMIIPASEGASPAPARLSELLATPEGLTHWDREIRGWYEGIHRQWWAPTTKAEAVAFRTLMDGVSASISPHRRDASRNWIDGADRFRAIGQAARDGHATLPQLRDALFALLNDEAATRVRIPSALVKGWRDAAVSNPLMAYLLQEFYGKVG